MMNEQHLPDKRVPYETLILLALILAAFFLRVWGITFGLPYLYHWDERNMFALRVIDFMAGGEILLKDLATEGLYKWVLGIGYGLWYLAGHLLGTFPSFTDFKDWVLDDPSGIMLFGRLIAAWAGTVTCVVLYKAGRWTYGRQEGLLAAILLAGVFLHVRDSHYAFDDIPLAFMATVAFYCSARVLRRGYRRDYLLAGLSAGLASATKFSGLAVIFLPLLAHLLRSKAQGRPYREWLFARPLLEAYLVAALALAIGTPYTWLYWPQTLTYLSQISQYNIAPPDKVEPDNGYLFYLISLGWGAGWLMAALMLLGVGLAFWRHKNEDLLALCAPLIVYGFIGRYNLPIARFMLPIYPFLALLAARCLVAAVAFIAHSERQRLLLTSAAMVVLLGQPLANSLRCDYIFTQKDTRTLAKEWIETNIPPESILVVERTGSPPLHDLYKSPAKDGEPGYWIYGIQAFGLDMDNTVQTYLNEGFQYAIINSYMHDMVLRDPELEQKRRREYAFLEQFGQLAAEFTPYRGDFKQPLATSLEQGLGPLIDVWDRERPGPIIKIYKRPAEE
jgi:4-amino-4-deoxy-L-arabinose transferase-like glycosyltransferase